MTESIGHGACQIAENVGAQAILAFTQTGSTAALVSKYRPNLPIYAMTPNEEVKRRMSLYSGVRAVRVTNYDSTELQVMAVEQAALKAGVVKTGDVTVITMGSPVSQSGTTNLLKVHQVGEVI